MDRFFQENQDILVFRDPDARSAKRPQKYIDQEQAAVRRNSSIVPADAEAAMRRRATLEKLNSGGAEEEGYGAHVENENGNNRKLE